MTQSAIPESNDPVATKIAAAEQKLATLERKCEVIGRPAANHLFDRIHSLKVEAHALKRNFDEQNDHSTTERLAKVERLLRHIEREESSLEHEVDFLDQAAPSSVTLAAEAGSRMAEAIGKRVGKVFEKRPFGNSVFVNHSHDSLVDYHGLDDKHDAERKTSETDDPPVSRPS